MYIALDQSPLRLSAFKLHDMMTSAERLTHALTVHYLSAAILGAGTNKHKTFIAYHHNDKLNIVVMSKKRGKV